MTTHNFYDSLSVEERYEPETVGTLRSIWHRGVVEKMPSGATESQFLGHDWSVTLPNGTTFYVDAKVDTYDSGYLAVEMWSNKEAGREGWAINDTMTNRYFLYLLPKRKCAYLLDKEMLYLEAMANYDTWRNRYRNVHIKNARHTTTCLLIPYQDIEHYFGVATRHPMETDK